MAKSTDPERPWLDTPPSLRKWGEVAPQAPFRASVPPGVTWSVAKPDPAMIDVWRTTRSRRIMLAFEFAEVRDLIVDAYADEGARAEPDRADAPAPWKAPANVAAAERTMEELFEEYVYAALERDAAEVAHEEVFCSAICDRIAAGDQEGAVAVLRAGGQDGILEFEAMEILRTAGVPRGLRVHPARLTPELAKARLDVQRTTRRTREIEGAFEPMVHARVEEILGRGAIDEAETFAETVPRCIGKAFVMDRIRQSRRQAASPTP